jgi:hypothetical protein
MFTKGYVQTAEHRRKISEALLGKNRKHTLKEDLFSVIDSEAKAYWLGFIMADGCVRRGDTLSTTLAACDSGHLDKMAAFLGTSSPVRYFDMGSGFSDRVTRGARLCVYSTKLVSDLAKVGILPNKTFCAEPWVGPPELMRHYWRGAVDGDGWVAVRKSSNHVGICGTYAIVQGFSSHINGKFDWSALPHPDKNIFRVEYSGVRNAADVARHLYDGATVYLDRKMAKAQEVMVREPQRRDWSWITKEEIERRHLEMGTWDKVADSFGMNHDILCAVRKYRGMDRVDGHASKGVIDELGNRYSSVRAAAKALGLSKSTLNEAVKFGRPIGGHIIRVDSP